MTLLIAPEAVEPVRVSLLVPGDLEYRGWSVNREGGPRILGVTELGIQVAPWLWGLC